MKLFKAKSKNVHFIAHTHVPMLDWDWPDASHKTDECITITCLNDVVKEIKEYLKYNQDYVRIYVTPGGVRAFFLKEAKTVEEFNLVLKSDPVYLDLVKRRGFFSWRISPKPNRSIDWVATHVLTLSNTKPNPELLNIVKEFHDKPISRLKNTKALAVTHNW